MAEGKIPYTDQQQRAIVARHSDVLVTASAGTGKTTVLSGRCVDIVADKAVCPGVQNMLVLTFTEMAAEQMRARIAERLRAAYLDSRDPHLRRQLVLLQGADISTIHSFCKRLITQYFHDLALDPTFSVIDADEARLLKADVLEMAIDASWRRDETVEGLEQLLRRRDLRPGDGFLGRVITLSDFLDGVVSRQDWCQRALALAAEQASSELGDKQKGIIAEKLRRIVDRLRNAQDIYREEAPDGDWAGKLEETHVKPVARCLDLLESGDWDASCDCIRGFAKPTTRTPKEAPEILGALLQKQAKAAITAFKDLCDLAAVNPDYAGKVGRAVANQTCALIGLVQKFDELYGRAKRSLNCLDFADLEHHALKLLTEKAGGELEPSAVAMALRERYKYIFVDEYQDINPVQQAILDALSAGGNVFVVGDVKQSIYAWRGAEPQIFLDRLAASGRAGKGQRIDLNANFRSAAGILDFVNRLFARIMTASFTGIDYDQAAELKPARAEQAACPPGGPLVELHMLDERRKGDDSEDAGHSVADDGKADVVTSRRRQAALIAKRIKQMVGSEPGRAEFQIFDKDRDCLRDVRYGDIVILMRSLAHNAKDYVEVLRLAGVPVSCQATAGYFEATEISDMLCLLKVLDNPQRDIELAAVLRSPFFCICDTKLAKIKIHGRARQNRQGLYNLVREYCESGPDASLATKLSDILARIDDWRTLARRGRLADLIWQVYRRTQYLSFVSALPSGQARRANLLKLHDRAIQFEGFVASGGIPSLRRFVEFIEKLQETGQDWAPAEPPSSAGNAVRILSVHKSKGLEFPVVFLAEIETQFNKRDIHADCLANVEDTLGLQIIDTASNTKLRSLAHEVIAEQKIAASLAEEMRILYVGTTRAKDRLILTASQKRKACARIVTNGFYLQGQPLPDWLLADCKSPLEWALYSLADQKSLHQAFETGLAEECRDDNLFAFTFGDQAEVDALSKFVKDLKSYSQTSHPMQRRERQRDPIINNQLSIINASLSWRYDFTEAVSLPAKTSVSALTHGNDEFVRFDYSESLQRRPACLASAESGLVETIEPRLIGTATHLVIAKLDLKAAVTGASIAETIEDLVGQNAVAAAVAEQIDRDAILAFFQTDLGRAALDPANKVHREWPFTFALPAPLVARDSSLVARTTGHESWVTDDEVVVVQGIIDMLIQTPHGLIVIDFKTDRITPAQAADRANLYRDQLNLYAKAASTILNAPRADRYLYFLAPGRMVDMQNEPDS